MSQIRAFYLCRRITEVDKAILDLKVQKRNLEIRFQNLCELMITKPTVDEAIQSVKRIEADIQDSMVID